MRPFGSLRIAAVAVVLFLSLAECMPNKRLEADYAGDAEGDEDSTPVVDANDPDPDDAPPIHVRSKNMTVTARSGDTVEFPCLVDNAEDTVINWLRDNEIIFTDDKPVADYGGRFTRAQNFSLIIRSVTEDDTADVYRCQILDDTPIEVVYRLHVVEKPRELWNGIRVEPGRRVEAIENTDVTLGCIVDVEPKPKIVWTHKRNEAEQGERPQHGVETDEDGSHIRFKKVTRHHAGRYQCLAADNSTKPAHDVIELIVKHTPAIDVEHEIVHTGTGIRSELTCIVHAHPHAHVTWYLNETAINGKDGRKHFIDDKSRRTLVIEHTSQNDLGEYKCEAKNKIGKASRTIMLTGAPSRPRFHEFVVADDESTLIVEWHVESYSPILEYQLEYRPKGESGWTKVNPIVTNGKGIQFTAKHALEGLKPGAYEARLIAKNTYGWSLHSNIETFREEIKSEEAETVKQPGGSSATCRPILALTALLLVAVSSYESTYL